MQATLQSITEALNSTTKGHNGGDNAEAEKTKGMFEPYWFTSHEAWPMSIEQGHVKVKIYRYVFCFVSRGHIDKKFKLILYHLLFLCCMIIIVVHKRRPFIQSFKTLRQTYYSCSIIDNKGNHIEWYDICLDKLVEIITDASCPKEVYELTGARHSNPQQDQDANLVEKDGVSSEHIEGCDSAQTINSTDNNKIVQPSVEESLFNETSIDINAQDSVILSGQKGSCKRAGGKTNNKSNRKKAKLANSSKDDKIITRLDLFYFENFKMIE